jgi:CTP:phosphocholine cytidylyltransferase-like protein
MRIIILGDRFKKGLKSKGCPGLIRANGDRSTIFDKQYHVFNQKFPNCEIIYVAGYDCKRLRHFIKKNYQDKKIVVLKNTDYERFNDVQSLNIAKEYLNDSCIIVSGYITPSMVTFDSLDKIYSQVFVTNKETSIGCVVNNKIVSNISFGLQNYISDIYYINKDDSLKLQKLIGVDSNKNCFLFEILNKIIEQDSIIKTHNIKE